MRIHFYEPPPAQKAGGLHAAIDSLRAALERLGHEVKINGAAPHAGECDAVHFHGLWQRNFPALAKACREQSIPYLVSPHGMLEPWARRKKWWKKWPYFHLIEKRWIAGAACVLATARPEAARLRQIFPGNHVESLPLGLTAASRPDYAAARESLGWGAEETVLLFLSRIHEKKGLDLLLSALASCADARPAATRLVIVGPEEQPGYAAMCRLFAQQHAAKLPKVEWAGEVWGDGRWPYFQGADLFCLPTHSENFGLAVLEACQVGTPALTTTETPWPDYLGEGRGYIARPDVAEIGAQLRRFLAGERRTDSQRAALADWAWSEFSWEHLGPRYAALYASLKTKHAHGRK